MFISFKGLKHCGLLMNQATSLLIDLKGRYVMVSFKKTHKNNKSELAVNVHIYNNGEIMGTFTTQTK